jgi:ribosomal protein S2
MAMEKADIEKVAHLETSVAFLKESMDNLEKKVEETNKVLVKGFGDVTKTLVSHIARDTEFKFGQERLLKGLVDTANDQKKADIQRDDKQTKTDLKLAKLETRIKVGVTGIMGSGGIYAVLMKIFP